MERWVPVKGYEDTYEISSLGRIRSLARKVKQGNRIVNRKPRLLTPVFLERKGGYFVVALIKDKKRSNIRLAPLVARHFIFDPEHVVRPVVSYKDKNPRNVRADNLEWAWLSDNLEPDGVLVKGTSDVYITPDGRLYKLCGGVAKFYKGNLSRLGYLYYTYGTGRRISTRSHVLVAEHYVPNPRPDVYNVVDHIDGDVSNNHYTNLRWCTQEMNNQFGREVFPFVGKVKYLLLLGIKARDIASKYNVSEQAIKNIKYGRTYKNIEVKMPDE